jgi:outer membrane protein OmpU
MTNMKKLGLTALAGSLVATSGFAGAVDVSGTAKVSYTAQDESEVTGNPYSMNQALGFSGSGDLDNGMSISYFYGMTNAAFSSSSLKLDMGDSGTLSFSNGASTTGISAYKDKMPSAGEEVWDDLDGQANGVAGISTSNTIGYAGSFADIGVSASWNKYGGTAEAASSSSLVLTTDTLMDGLSAGIGIGNKAGTTSNNETDQTTYYATYTMGSVTMGAQYTEIDVSAAASDTERMHYAISMAVNENLSVSLGQSTVDFESTSKSDQESVGIALSYTMGSMTLKAEQNSEDSTGGTAGSDDTHTEVSLAFAF